MNLKALVQQKEQHFLSGRASAGGVLEKPDEPRLIAKLQRDIRINKSQSVCRELTANRTARHEGAVLACGQRHSGAGKVHDRVEHSSL